MNIYQIPTIGAHQRFTIRILDNDYVFELRWNSVMRVWVLAIYSNADLPLVSGVALVEGTDLLEQHTHILPFGLFVDGVATFDSLGSTVNLYGVW